MKHPSSMNVSTLILGGGLAGLSTAFHLNQKVPYLLIEKENKVGGTARSFCIKGFTFDLTGHLLHLHKTYSKNLIYRLLKGNYERNRRDAWIFSNGVYTPYPFQAYTKGLPEPILDQCVLGVLKTQLKKRNAVKSNSTNLSFNEWCENNFGSGISQQFMVPYNEKLFQTSVKNMTSEWCGPFVPKPLLEDILRGALIDPKKQFGYNTTFIYPKKGGIQSLPNELAKGLDPIILGLQVKK